MLHRNVSRSRFLLLTLLLPVASVASAQTWTKIGAYPNIHCSYFWDVNHGVIGGSSGIYYFNNGTWAAPTIPEPVGFFHSIRLLHDTLYAVGGSTCTWSSLDSGKTWSKTKYGLGDDIYL